MKVRVDGPHKTALQVIATFPCLPAHRGTTLSYYVVLTKLRLRHSFELARTRISPSATVVNLVVALFLVCCANGPLWDAASAALGATTGHRFFLVLFGVALVLL